MNIKHSNGRIYKSGDGVSDTISPYSSNFWDNIEEGIKPLVKVFLDKLYLPYSSCAGHPRMFIAIAVCGLDEAQKLRKELTNIGEYLQVSIKSPNDYLDVGEGENGPIGNRKLAQVNILNEIYCRGYSDYMMVEATVLEHNKLPELIKSVKQLDSYLV